MDFKNMSKSEMSTLAVVSFVMLLVSGTGVIAVECCFCFFDSHIEITTQILLAYIAVLIFWPLVVVSFVLGLISIFRVIIKKQRGGILAMLAVIFSILLIIWIFIREFAPGVPEYYGPTVSGSEVQKKNDL